MHAVLFQYSCVYVCVCTRSFVRVRLGNGPKLDEREMTVSRMINRQPTARASRPSLPPVIRLQYHWRKARSGRPLYPGIDGDKGRRKSLFIGWVDMENNSSTAQLN